jgi:hypothetical protein
MRRKIEQFTFGKFDRIDAFIAAAGSAANRLTPISLRAQPTSNDIPLISMIRSELQYLPKFLNHYRRLGVDRFIFLDTGSTDGSREYLSSQRDVDLWAASGSFREYRPQWLTAAAHAFATDRWFVFVDADEFLVYPDMETRDLHELTTWLEKNHFMRVRGNMIDVYGHNPIAETPLPDGGDIFAAQWWMDGPSSYYLKNDELRGGPRSRVFSHAKSPFQPALQKFPLQRFDSASAIVSVHHPYPFFWNAGPPYVALLHFKFTQSLLGKIENAVREKQYWKDSYEYRVYRSLLKADPQLSLWHIGSRRYEGTATLLDAKVMAGIPWEKSSRSGPSSRLARRHDRDRAHLAGETHFDALRDKYLKFQAGQ